MNRDNNSVWVRSVLRNGAAVRGHTKLRLRSEVLLCVLFGISSLWADQPKPNEYQVEAVYLLNFAKFVEWPATALPPESTFNICVLGQYPFGAALERTIAGESIDGHKVLVQRISRPQDATGCRILFISLSEETRLPEILKTVYKSSVLTVSNVPKFSQQGGMIQFVMEANKVRFEVNLSSAERAGLTLSSELLKVATSVTRNGQIGH
jgi:YfiR/HmsC-like